MSLLVNPDELVMITVHFDIKDNRYSFYEEAKEGAKSESFFFKRPDWGDQRTIVSHAFGINGMDPYSYMDAKLKVLLRKWTLKYEDGKDVEVSEQNIDRLEPALVNHLDERVNRVIILPEDPDTSGKKVNDGLPDEREEA